jgi:hypothetical protein
VKATKNYTEAVSHYKGKLASVELPLITEIKVQTATIESIKVGYIKIDKELKVLKAILRTPRMYNELRKG